MITFETGRDSRMPLEVRDESNAMRGPNGYAIRNGYQRASNVESEKSKIESKSTVHIMPSHHRIALSLGDESIRVLEPEDKRVYGCRDCVGCGVTTDSAGGNLEDGAEGISETGQ